MNHDTISLATSLAKEHQREYSSGRWYITPNGLKSIAKAIGFDLSIISKEKKKEFRRHCIDAAQGHPSSLRDKNYYLNNIQ